MTAAAVPAGIVPPRPAWRSLLWTVPLTGMWMLLIYLQPAITASGVPSAAARLMAYGLIAVGLGLALQRTDLPPGERRTTWLAVLVPYTLWMAFAWSAGINGVFHASASPLPLLPMAILLPVIIGAPLLLSSRRLGRVLSAMPASWLIALQLYRILGSVFLVAGLRGAMVGAFAYPAGIGDVLTGLFAVPTAIAVASGNAQGRRAAIAWNLFGLADFAVAITMGAITSPGPFQLLVSNTPSIGAGDYPNVLTPIFVVPSSILLHALSLRQLLQRPKAEAAR
jgi:hypothetical protein